jgi:ribonuclease HI
VNSNSIIKYEKCYNIKKHELIWVKGHADNIENNRCDELAVQISKKNNLPIDEGYVFLKV